MDVSDLAAGRDSLVATMTNRGYSSDWIRRYVKMLDFILENNDAEQWRDYGDVFETFCLTASSPSVRSQAKSILAGIERFHREGEAPGDGRRNQPGRVMAYLRLQPTFKEVVDAYAAREADRGTKKQSTIYGECKCLSRFLLSMQERGCPSLSAVREPDVLSFFVGADGKVSKRRSYAEALRGILKAMSDDRECARLLVLVPKPKPKKNPMRGLTGGDVDALMGLLRSDAVSARDRAVGLLLITYGLRSCDVAGLKLSAIDWLTPSLAIRQQKTGVPVALPLLPEVGNALYDYITSERPECGDPYVFHSVTRPYGPLTSGGVYGVAVKLLDTAGIKRANGERRGSHVFRHRVATALLGKGEAQPVISAVLGHENPGSVEAYLSADIAHLRECALSIERFPMPEEVFSRWASSTS